MGLEPAQLIDDEAVTRGAVEQHDKPGEEEQERDEQRKELIKQSWCPIARALHLKGIRTRVHSYIVHQNACPSDTLTANGPSPFCRFKGTPKSTRIGPKLE